MEEVFFIFFWVSGVSEIRTTAPAYNNALSYQLSYTQGTQLTCNSLLSKKYLKVIKKKQKRGRLNCVWCFCNSFFKTQMASKEMRERDHTENLLGFTPQLGFTFNPLTPSRDFSIIIKS